MCLKNTFVLLKKARSQILVNNIKIDCEVLLVFLIFLLILRLQQLLQHHSKKILKTCWKVSFEVQHYSATHWHQESAYASQQWWESTKTFIAAVHSGCTNQNSSMAPSMHSGMNFSNVAICTKKKLCCF